MNRSPSTIGLRGVDGLAALTTRAECRMRQLLTRLRRTAALNPSLRYTAAAAALALLAALALAPIQGLGWLALAALAIYAGLWWARAHVFADARVQLLVGPAGHLMIHAKLFPMFKWVDLYQSAEALAASDGAVGSVPAYEGIQSVYRVQMRSPNEIGDQSLSAPVTLSRPISADSERALLTSCCWCFPPGPLGRGAPVLVRVGLMQHTDRVIVEVGARTTELAQEIMERLTDWASAHSIYRNRTLRVTFESGPPTRFGREDQAGGLQISFVQERAVPEEEIVLDDLTRTVLEHTVIDFHRRRAELMALGLPGKRGVLFYGPPGTGKTYTSAYLSQRLSDATKVIAAGKSLLRMADVCAVATSLQPALVILEDVDLVFSDREMAPNTTLLGEFLDQLDGFASNDQIIFILTTNVLERVEAAIKDRPGRVSQCIYFGPPNAELRGRYLAAQLRRFDAAAVRVERIAAQTEGASQAFLKELVLRAVQIASARPYESLVTLTDADFDHALREMTGVGGKPGRRIIGFQVEEQQ
jgi:cell division protease FtsH